MHSAIAVLERIATVAGGIVTGHTAVTAFDVVRISSRPMVALRKPMTVHGRVSANSTVSNRSMTPNSPTDSVATISAIMAATTVEATTRKVRRRAVTDRARRNLARRLSAARRVVAPGVDGALIQFPWG